MKIHHHLKRLLLVVFCLEMMASPIALGDQLGDALEEHYDGLLQPPTTIPITPTCGVNQVPNPGWPGNGQGQCIYVWDPILSNCNNSVTIRDAIHCCAQYASVIHTNNGGFMGCGDCLSRFIPPTAPGYDLDVHTCAIKALDNCFNGGLTIGAAICDALIPDWIRD